MEVGSHFADGYTLENSSVVEVVEMDCLVGNQQVTCHPSEDQEDTCKKLNINTSYPMVPCQNKRTI